MSARPVTVVVCDVAARCKTPAGEPAAEHLPTDPARPGEHDVAPLLRAGWTLGVGTDAVDTCPRCNGIDQAERVRRSVTL